MSTSDTPFKLKNIYTLELLRSYGLLIKEIWNPFPVKKFTNQVFNDEWPSLELKQRMRHISSQMQSSLPSPYAHATEIVTASAEHLIALHGARMTFEYGFMADFIERFGLDQPDISIPALEQITQWTSAEFAVRPYLLKYPDRMHQQMYDWSFHSSPFVRRLSSEGIRPRLPWGLGVPPLKRDPSPVLRILENLKNDPAETVRRSVANNLNDIAKDHPSLVLKTITGWKGTSEETEWVIKHASRGLLKKGDTKALKLFGFVSAPTGVIIEHFKCGKSVPIDGKLDFSFTIHNQGKKSVKTRLEYTIDFITSTGKNSIKVFQIREKVMEANRSESVKRFQRFSDLTTRKHFPGRHRLAIILNGQEVSSAEFMVKG
jgi:3-methyladenine DNA glycosylase AlkC